MPDSDSDSDFDFDSGSWHELTPELQAEDSNAFESGIRKVIPAVLVYIRRDKDVLMIHRNGGSAPSTGDFHQGKWNGLGGKLEADESPLEGAVREVREESGIVVEPLELVPLGVIQFPHFKPHRNEDWMVFIFTVNLPSMDARQPNKACKEGSLHWVDAASVEGLNLWPGDRHFLKYVLESKPFLGTIWYEQSQVKRFWVQSMGDAVDYSQRKALGG